MLRLPITQNRPRKEVGVQVLPARGRARSWVVAMGQSSAERISTVRVSFWEA